LVIKIVVLDIRGYKPLTKIPLSVEKMANLGWKTKVNLVESYRKMIEYIKENEENGSWKVRKRIYG
jgi:hypothetical protein